MGNATLSIYHALKLLVSWRQTDHLQKSHSLIRGRVSSPHRNPFLPRSESLKPSDTRCVCGCVRVRACASMCKCVCDSVCRLVRACRGVCASACMCATMCKCVWVCLCGKRVHVHVCKCVRLQACPFFKSRSRHFYHQSLE